MSDDPFLHNDQLRNSATPSVGWNDVPPMFQKQIFEHVGCIRKVSCQRVCKSWKSLLEDWPGVLLMDEFDRTIRNQSVAESYKVFQEVLRGAFRKSRVLIVDFSPKTAKKMVDFEFLLDFTYGYAVDTLSIAITTDGNLEHVVLTGGRVSPKSYFELLKSLKLHRVKRTLQFTNYNMVCATNHTDDFADDDMKYKLYSEEFEGSSLLKWSVRCPVKQDTLCRQVLLAFKKMVFPYTLAQIGWLDKTIWLVLDQEEDFLSRELGGVAEYMHYCNDSLDYCNEMKSHVRLMKSDFRFEYATANSAVLCDKKLAGAMSLFARKISTGEMKLPPPPESVPLCPVHTNSAICSCLLAIGDFSVPSKQRHL